MKIYHLSSCKDLPCCRYLFFDNLEDAYGMTIINLSLRPLRFQCLIALIQIATVKMPSDRQLPADIDLSMAQLHVLRYNLL